MSGLSRKIKRGLYILRYEGVLSLFAALRKRATGSGKTFQDMQSEMLTLPTAKDRFSKIYEENLWGGIDSLSGEGSTIEYTQNLRDRLPSLVEEYEIRSMVDSPCGDFAWMKLILPSLNVDYTGCDIVETVIRNNTKMFSAPGVTFLEKDICADPLPEADLIFVRDCLFHLSLEDIDRFLQNLSRTTYKYLLTTSHRVEGRPDFENTDIETGGFRLIDLHAPPFGFKKDDVLMAIEDYLEGQPPRDMLLFARKDVPTWLERAETR